MARKPPLSRKPREIKRRERYLELRALGYTPTEATRLRDLSGDNIQKQISRTRRRISRKPVAMRTSEETFRLARIQNRQRVQSQVQQDGRLGSRESRWRKFSEYSKINKFPKKMRDRIAEINSNVGKPPLDGYGYRRFYYEYVERLDIREASNLANRNDSGMRYLLNKSLVTGRMNLRRLFSPPKPQESSKAS